MTLVLLDPNLEGEAGHHLAYDLAIAREALARGEAVTIFAHRRFAAAAPEGVRIVPHFTRTTYEVEHHDPVTGRFDDYRLFNDTLASELALLPREEFAPGDAVLVPTVTETQLLGYVGWMKSFDPIEAPLFVVHLMFPSGVALDGAGSPQVEDPLRALFYRLAFRAAAEDGPRIRFFASGGQHAREFSALAGAPIAPHPLPIAPEPVPRSPGRRALLFAGDARAEKGVVLLPELARRLAAAHPDWRFTAHVNTGSAWGEAREAGEALIALDGSAPNLACFGGWLEPARYLDLLREADLVLFPYDPSLYRRKSSGVLWEAVSLGVPVIVPAGTWLEQEARYWGAGHVGYGGHGVAAIEAAFAAALPRHAALVAQSHAASGRYRGANGPAALLDQIGMLSVAHRAAASLVARPQEMEIALEDLRGAGWHGVETANGARIRWTEKTPEIAFDWPFGTPWELRLTLGHVFGEEQLAGMQVLANGNPLRAEWRFIEKGVEVAVTGEGGGTDSPTIELRFVLPFTRRPPGDTRDLGVLVRRVLIRPHAAEPGAPSAAAHGPGAFVLSPPRPEGGWPVAPALSGGLAADTDRPLQLTLHLAVPGGPPVARALAFYVNGVPVSLELRPEGPVAWRALARINPAVLRRGLRQSWDLLAPAEAPPSVLLAITAERLAGRAVPLATGESAPDASPDGPAAADAAPPQLATRPGASLPPPPPFLASLFARRPADGELRPDSRPAAGTERLRAGPPTEGAQPGVAAPVLILPDPPAIASQPGRPRPVAPPGPPEDPARPAAPLPPPPAFPLSLGAPPAPSGAMPPPAAPAAGPPGRPVEPRWDLSFGFGPPEGPFPQLGIPVPVRWMTTRSAVLALEAETPGPARLRLRYRCPLPRLGLRLALNGADPAPLEVTGGALSQAGQLEIPVTLRAGPNELALDSEAGLIEPGTGRELILLLEGLELA